MYVILVYDIQEDRVYKVLKVCRKYLTWIQNSVLEGEISESDLMLLKDELANLIDTERDSIVLYEMRTAACLSKETIGALKGEPTSFI